MHKRLLIPLLLLLAACTTTQPAGDTPAATVAAPASPKPRCKHSVFTKIEVAREYDTIATSLSLYLDHVDTNAAYRWIAQDKAHGREGRFDGKGSAEFWTDPGYQGEYFLEIKAPGHEPLLLESIRIKGGRGYDLNICLAPGSSLQRYKYLGEKGTTGVLESLN